MEEAGNSPREKQATRAGRTVEIGSEVVPTTERKREIAQALGNLQYEKVEGLVRQAIAAGTDPLEILDQCKAGMDTVGELYGSGEYFLSELILSAEIFKKVVDTVKPLIVVKREAPSFASVIIGTPKGDIHDLGKNLVATLFVASGFDVTDLGVDVAPEVFVDELSRRDAKILAMSALITPTFDSMKRVVDLLHERDLREGRFVIIGGGPTSEAVRDYVGADAWTLNPVVGIRMCREFTG